MQRKELGSLKVIGILVGVVSTLMIIFMMGISFYKDAMEERDFLKKRIKELKESCGGHGSDVSNCRQKLQELARRNEELQNQVDKLRRNCRRNQPQTEHSKSPPSVSDLLTIGSSVRGRIIKGMRKWYHFKGKPNQGLVLTLLAETRDIYTQVGVTYFDQRGNKIRRIQIRGGKSEEMDFTTQSSGWHKILVEGKHGRTPYSMTLSEYGN
jgi:FtsZ-binding cell division protein ZapB